MTALSEACVVDERYRLGEVLGAGASAVVRRARDHRLERDVAVKLYRPGHGAREQHDELAIMAAFDHPNLVHLFDAGDRTDVDGVSSPYLILELVAGKDLRCALHDGPLRTDQVASIGIDLAAALSYVHCRHVVHGDVKPANVLLTGDRVVHAKLADFGVAHHLDDRRATDPGTTVGTANYLSPEQVRGDRGTPASDVYSFGLLLLEALTGQRAYRGSGVPAALARLDSGPAIPATLGPDWGGLLSDMVASDPQSRPTAAQVHRRIPMADRRDVLRT